MQSLSAINHTLFYACCFCSFLNYLYEMYVIIVEQYEEIIYKCT